MDLAGKYDIPAKKDIVWNALNNADILKKSIKGCETLEKTSENEFNAKVKAKIGPVSATFNGFVKISDIIAPNSYTLSGEGKGGAAGFAKGSVKISLLQAENPEHTTLNYVGYAQVGGKLAQIGSRLVGGVIQKTTDDFFVSFCNNLGNLKSNFQKSTLIEESLVDKKRYSIPYWIWIGGIVFLTGIIVIVAQ